MNLMVQGCVVYQSSDWAWTKVGIEHCLQMKMIFFSFYHKQLVGRSWFQFWFPFKDFLLPRKQFEKNSHWLIEWVCFKFGMSLITSILSRWAADHLCLLLFKRIALQLKKSFRCWWGSSNGKQFSEWYLKEAKSLDQKWNGLSFTIDDEMSPSKYSLWPN